MDDCEKCSACLRICPTGAISDERFLIRAERCLTFLNEKPGDVPFPAWLDASWHNCLVGCMHCQRVCPENKDVVDWAEEEEQFTEDETALLLEGLAADQMPAMIGEKLQRADLIDLLDVLPRNLRALFSLRSEE